MPLRVYRLKVSLRGARPPIWRRFAIPADLSLKQLHRVLQIVMGWTDSHLHQFEGDGELFGQSDEFVRRASEARTRIGDLLQTPRDYLDYDYDFGDGWSHRIVLEAVEEVPSDSSRPAPRVLKAKGACPPEDVGGLGGYEMFLEALADPKHPDHDQYREWHGPDFDPAAYDLDGVNARLARLRLTPPKSARRPARSGGRPAMSRTFAHFGASTPADDERFLKRLEARMADPTTILNDREVRVLAEAILATVSEAIDVGAQPPLSAIEDIVRWRSVTASCERARAERDLTTKEAARRLKAPQMRVRAVEEGRERAFQWELAVRYFRMLGLEKWVGRWARANGEYARRLGIA